MLIYIIIGIIYTYGQHWSTMYLKPVIIFIFSFISIIVISLIGMSMHVEIRSIGYLTSISIVH